MKRILILFGGKSAEHEVSIRSARNVLAALDRSLFEPVLVGIDKQGSWHEVSETLLQSTPESLPRLAGAASTVVPGSERHLVLPSTGNAKPIDAAFPILHGPLGEDGSVQGLLRLAGIPFVGPSVLGSAVNMDKDVEKRLLRDAGLPIAKFVTITRRDRPSYDNLAKQLGAILFVKPANMGSSVGVSKVRNAAELEQALADALRYDRKVVIEEFIQGRELECAVLGNESPAASAVGEILPQKDFYSYEAKYVDENGAILQIPADLPDGTVKRIQELSVRAFQATGCEGMARVDFFLKESGEPVINELNTIPGFTNISMYPKLWEASGISYGELITKLIGLAIERGTEERQLLSEYKPLELRD